MMQAEPIFLDLGTHELCRFPGTGEWSLRFKMDDDVAHVRYLNEFEVKMVEAALNAPRPEVGEWISVKDRLPEGKTGVPYMTYMTDTVLVLHKDRPDYPITAHAALGDDLDMLGVRIPTNGASKYKWISWFSVGRDGSNPFDMANLRDYARYEKKLPNYLGFGITHWKEISLPQNDERKP